MKAKTLIIGLIVTVFCGCNNFLDENPYSFASGEVLFTSAENAEMALTGVYDVLTASNIQGNAEFGMFSRNIHLLSQLGCDEMIGRTDFIPKADNIPFCNYTYNSESRLLSDTWFALYAGIHRANVVLANLPSVPMDSTRKAEIMLEAKFMRAFFYSYLTWFFGAVPLQLSTENGLLPRSSIQDVSTVVISDMEAAYAQLPVKNKYDSRINKYSAGAFLLRVYLYLAACKENKVGQSFDFTLNSFDWVDSPAYYTRARDIAKDIYENSSYILLKEYRYNFMADNLKLKAEQGKEAIMLATCGIAGRRFFFFGELTGPAGHVRINGGGSGWYPAQGELASLYNPDDIRFKQNIGGACRTNPPFQTENILGVTYHVPEKLYNEGRNTFLTKFRQSDPAEREAAGVPFYLSIMNIPIVRLADVILMYAEAAYKIGDEATARVLLEKIRYRAAYEDAMLAETLKNEYFKADFMEELKDERSRELCAECLRRFDLIRWGKLEEVVQNLKTSNENGLIPNVFYFNESYVQPIKDNFETYKIWYPIPMREYKLNPLLEQNPGWERKI